MTISSRVQQQFFASSGSSAHHREIIRLPLTLLGQIDYWSMAPHVTYTCSDTSKYNAPKRRSNLWTAQEHDRFLHGLELFPQGPWRRIAAVVRTKTTRQTMTHAQKYRQKIKRHQQAPTAAAEAKVAVVPVPYTPKPLASVSIGSPTHVASRAIDNTFANSIGCMENDLALKALINSLEPIDDPDAWSLHVEWSSLTECEK